MIKNPNKVGQGDPYSYLIDNSRQFLVITGQSHHELRLIVESFLQANQRQRTRYKCCALHHCTCENQISRDTYYIVKNIMRQILRTMPVLKEYLLISENKEFKLVLEEIFDESTNAKHSLMETQYPDVFVKFIKKINQLKLDSNIVIIITGLEFAFENSNL